MSTGPNFLGFSLQSEVLRKFDTDCAKLGALGLVGLGIAISL